MIIQVIEKAVLEAWRTGYCQQFSPTFAEQLEQRFGQKAAQIFHNTPVVSRAAFVNASGLSVSAVRHYCQLGLLPAFRHGQKYLFSLRSLEVAKDIQEMRSLGLRLEEIKKHLETFVTARQHSLSALAQAVDQPTNLENPQARHALRLALKERFGRFPLLCNKSC
jgi:DNA-binding transcriptional MerR regulator